MIELGIVLAGHEMLRIRTASQQANAEFTGKFGVCGRHERRHLLVMDLNKLDAASRLFRTLKRTEHTVNAIAGIA